MLQPLAQQYVHRALLELSPQALAQQHALLALLGKLLILQERLNVLHVWLDILQLTSARQLALFALLGPSLLLARLRAVFVKTAVSTRPLQAVRPVPNALLERISQPLQEVRQRAVKYALTALVQGQLW